MGKGYLVALSEDMKRVLDGTFEVAINNAKVYGKYKLAEQMEIVQKGIDEQYKMSYDKDVTAEGLLERLR